MKTPLVSVLKIGHKDTDGYDIVLKPVSRDSEGRVFSPFFLGPVSLPSCVGGPRDVFHNFENAWQYSKVYPKAGHLDWENNITDKYLEWRQKGADMEQAQRYPMGRVDVLCSLIGRSGYYGGKTNQLQHYLHSLPEEERQKFLANARIIAPRGDAFEVESRMEELLSYAERTQKGLQVMVTGDMHVAISGGGRVPPRPSDLRAALDGRNIYIEYGSCGGLRAKNAAECAERPNTTDMFRMFRDNRNKPKRGRK